MTKRLVFVFVFFGVLASSATHAKKMVPKECFHMCGSIGFNYKECKYICSTL